jgi:hypothetical protein
MSLWVKVRLVLQGTRCLPQCPCTQKCQLHSHHAVVLQFASRRHVA